MAKAPDVVVSFAADVRTRKWVLSVPDDLAQQGLAAGLKTIFGDSKAALTGRSVPKAWFADRSV